MMQLHFVANVIYAIVVASETTVKGPLHSIQVNSCNCWNIQIASEHLQMWACFSSYTSLNVPKYKKYSWQSRNLSCFQTVATCRNSGGIRKLELF